MEFIMSQNAVYAINTTPILFSKISWDLFNKKYSDYGLMPYFEVTELGEFVTVCIHGDDECDGNIINPDSELEFIADLVFPFIEDETEFLIRVVSHEETSMYFNSYHYGKNGIIKDYSDYALTQSIGETVSTRLSS